MSCCEATYKHVFVPHLQCAQHMATQCAIKQLSTEGRGILIEKIGQNSWQHMCEGRKQSPPQHHAPQYQRNYL